MKVAVFVGTRPEIIKMQPIIKEIEEKHNLIFIQTGQHYDFVMSGIFINELKLNTPDYTFNVKATTQASQTANIIKKSETILRKEKPDIVLVEGDTNSALGVAVASVKLGVPVGHVEAGCRSFDKTMPEEINRILISDVASLHFSPTPNCSQNLLREGIMPAHIFLTGHPIVDLLANIAKRLSRINLSKLVASDVDYALVTMHRRENIENQDRITEILDALNRLARNISIIFPCHPHTKLQITKFGLANHLKNLRVIDPVGYIDSLNLIKYAKFVLTDSGGVQQEAAILKTPCITLRERTEWVETINLGLNFLAGYNVKSIIKTVMHVEKNYNKIVTAFDTSKNIFGKIGVSKRILGIIESDG